MKRLMTTGLTALLLTSLLAGCQDELLEDLAPAEEPQRQEAKGFEWTKAEDIETRSQFMRNFGVGYSYDAVRGSYCDWQDIRCQVLNRSYLQDMQDNTGEMVISLNQTKSTQMQAKFDYSLRDYIANVALNLKEKVDLGLYSKEKRSRQYFIEDGVQEQFFYSHEEKITFVRSSVGYSNILANYRKYPQMFTLSFRNAIEHLKESDVDDIAAVDSFVRVYGTHVVVAASLGGSLRIDLKNDMWRWSAKAKDEEWTSEEFLGQVQENSSHTSTESEYRWTEHSRLNMTARGGDQSSLTSLLGEHKADGSRTFSLDGISAWRTSIKYDPADELNSNVEMIEMTLVPIWDFADVISRVVALRIKAAVQQDAALQQELLGDRNFFSVKFPMRYTTATCQWRKATGTWQTATRTDSSSEPMIVNIVSGGSYVASVCHETIDGKRLWVCYPIYEGKINLACGLGVADDGNCYGVRWIDGSPTLTERGTTTSQTFYINAGEVDVDESEEVIYADAFALPYVELSGGVTVSGGYNAAGAYNVHKSGSSFELTAPAGLTDIVGFADSTAAGGSNRIYRRNSNYTYIYNPNEVK